MRTAHLLLPLATALALAACSPGDAAPASTASASPAAEPATAGTADAEAIAGVSGTYELDPTHTGVIAQWTHFGFSRPVAHFGDVSGRIVYDADNIGASSVEVTLPLSGLDTHVDALDEHLRGPDFFDAAQFPEATFRSTSVEADGVNRLKVTGDLTIKDVTRPVVLDVTVNGFGEHPMVKRAAAGFDAVAEIRRSDFGVGAYAPNVSDEVELRITAEALVPESGAADAAAE